MPDFTCGDCGATFSLPDTVLARYPGWTPRQCRACRDGTSGGGGKASSRRSPRAPLREENLTVGEVLARYQDGPQDGVFTDGSAQPNPGPGGWGAVHVTADEVVAQRHGHEPHTTNNRMELTALLVGLELVPAGDAATVYSDSRLVVDTVNVWAKGWAERGWKRKTGEIANLDLVQAVYAAASARPDVTVAWIRAHDGARWNEYADSLATAYRRDSL